MALDNSNQYSLSHVCYVKPVSLAIPTFSEYECSNNLENCLTDLGVRESNNEKLKRDFIIAKLNDAAINWIRNTENDSELNDRVRLIYPFGSFVYGDIQRNSSLDLIFIAPHFIKRKQFIQDFFAILENLPEIIEAVAVDTVRIPNIRLNINDVAIYLTFANVKMNFLLKLEDMRDTAIYKDMDTQCGLSMNGYLTALDVLDCIPRRESFVISLMAIKHWAKKRGIYSAKLGFLGGISWAIMLIRICQLYPNATASILVKKFFAEYSKWSWPEPVRIKGPINDRVNKKSRLRNWDSKYHSKELMPILTPAFPQRNTAYHITASTRKIIVDEIRNGMTRTDEIIDGIFSWEILFQQYNFFERFSYFLVVNAISKSEFQKSWFSIVESKIRSFTKELENNIQVKFLHVFPKSYDSCRNEGKERTIQRFWFIGLIVDDYNGQEINVKLQIENFQTGLAIKSKDSNFSKEDVSHSTTLLNSKELKTYLPSDVFIEINP